MASSSPSGPSDLTQSGVTIPSDSEIYEGNNELSSSPPSSSPLILYSPPSAWGLFRGAVINLFLPFVNGLMLGFGELFAHEMAFRLGWANTKALLQVVTRSAGPGVEIRNNSSSSRRKLSEDLDLYTSLE
ncbi:TOM13-domain-containing protein [Trichodelitschia bisporula]|uniref:TOM13-domain-containing protein n=1 Tax=Trichodelitschia bisporula TaxID=703511 RepID=A0A6G1I4P9_9PEZI|nr:TOM13-domain-containing protein [Trichodelitschia bisporula]